jgi:uncharacterized protein YxjI
MKLNRVVLALTAAAVTITSFAGCSMAYGDSSTTTPVVTQDAADSDAVLDTLRWADTIVLKKKAMSLNDQYEVTADGKKVGEIQGQYIYSLGDTYSLFSTAGNLVASEGEAYRVVKHEAKLYDYNNKPAGSIKEDMALLLTRWSIYDSADAKIGQAEQNFSWTLKFDVKNAKGEAEYTISKAAFTIGAEMTIKRVTNEPTVPVMNAVWLAAIANEIDEAQQAKNNSNN